ncbi:MAG: hypothetical protein Q8R44_19830, partial [Novosphingobium sp.]|nr:hypothetical protein [Novosphingobium sp.]
LDNEEVSDHPFVSVTPIRMPHKVIGKALADLTKDVQLIKSTVLRQILDNAYNINNGRTAINERVSLADALSPRPNQVVRIRGEGPVGDAISAIQPNPIAQHLFPVLEYLDNWKELKTGVSRLNQGIDADTLNDTARGVALLQNAGNQRIKFLARQIAETGFKDLGRKILRLVVDHQDHQRMIRLRGQFVPMDPRSWNAEMDVTINVGVGYGNKQQETMLLGMLGTVFEKIMAYQGGLDGPILKIRGMKALIDKQIASIGYKPAAFLEDMPDDYEMPPKQPQPDPKMIEVQLTHQREMMKLQLGHQLKQQELGLDVQEMNMEHMREMAKLDMEAAHGAIELSIKAQQAKAQTKIAASSAKDKAGIAAYAARRKADQPRPTKQ